MFIIINIKKEITLNNNILIIKCYNTHTQNNTKLGFNLKITF